MALEDAEQSALDALRLVFHDMPDLLRIVTAKDLASEQLLQDLRQREEMFSAPVMLYVVGRTGAGKTSLGNQLFGSEVMRSTGHINCTDYIGLLRMRSNLFYIDTPGAGSEEKFENWARLSLGLKQVDEDPATDLGVYDFTGAAGIAAGEPAAKQERYTAEKWQSLLATSLSPDVVLYVVAPHMQFIRPDREFLTAVLEKHREKVLIAFNSWEGVTSPIHIADATKAIDSIYRRVFPDGSIESSHVTFDVKNGTGIDDVTNAICRIVPPEKIGSMQQVLRDTLKGSALRERSRRYHANVSQIAARLALHTVDQAAGDETLIAIAAAGICSYGIQTFEASELMVAFNAELSQLIEERVESVRQSQQDEIRVQDIKTSTRDITEKEPVWKTVETVRNERRTVVRQYPEAIGVSLPMTVFANLEAGIKHAFTRRDDKEAHRRITEERKRNTAKIDMVTRRVTVEQPVRRIEQVIDGYRTRVVDTVTEVTDMTERVIGYRALRGGVPVIELLLTLGLGIERYCTMTGDRPSAADLIDPIRQYIVFVLDRERPQLDVLLREGTIAEPAITELLARAISVPDQA